jgi:soluble epoxide hydrolase/lipid-phosphate phosphatase
MDRGSFLLSRLANFYPSLFTKLVFLDIGYSAPGHGLTRTTVSYINHSVQSALGYSVFGYFLFFEEENVAKLLDENVRTRLIYLEKKSNQENQVESALSLFFSTDAEVGKKYMGATGGFREWLTEGKVAPSPPFVSSEVRSPLDISISCLHSTFI